MPRIRIIQSLVITIAFATLVAATGRGQDAPRPADALSVQWEELTAPDFVQAVERSSGVCLLPFGILEKHGPHLPLGTDLFDARALALRAAKNEYSLVFPAYYFGQIFEAKSQPGTVAYSERLMWDLLQETC